MHHHKPNLRQSNKPFKGRNSSKKKTSHKDASHLVHKKQKPVLKHNRDNKRNQKRKNKLNQLIKKKLDGNSNIPILCTIVPFSSFSDPYMVLKSIAEYTFKHFPGNTPPTALFKDIKANKVFHFKLNELNLSICIAKYGDILNSLDPIKCSDIILASFGYNDDFQSFDDFGYKLLKSIKLQGQSNTIGLFSSDNKVNIENNLTDCEKVLRKSFDIEFPNSKFFSLSKENDVRSLISTICCMNTPKMSLRHGRGYVLSEFSDIRNISEERNETQLIIRGFVRGVGLSVNFPVHVTGFGDFTIKEICSIPLYDVEMSSYSFDSSEMSTNFIQMNEYIEYETSTEKIPATFSHNDNPMELELDNANNLEIDEAKMDLGKNLEVKACNGYGSENFNSKTTDERKIDQRTICRTRFSKYRGLESLRTSNWDPHENLPDEYSKISEIENFKKTGELSRKLYFDNCVNENFVGKYCEIVLVPVTSETEKLLTTDNISRNYIVLSSVLPLEQKIGVMNFRVKRTSENRDIVRNKTPLILQAGFRRLFICPMFSNFPRLSSSSTIERGQILKMCSIFTHEEYFIISCYSKILFPPCPVIIFSISECSNTMEHQVGIYKDFEIPRNISINEWPLAWGDIIDADPYHIVVKRIILVGSIFKVRKNKGIVRFMFNNPEDVKWFMPIGLKTRNGVRGVIREPLGTHGYMKCLFNKPIQQNEVVGMSIYKRVFPKWFPLTWFENK